MDDAVILLVLAAAWETVTHSGPHGVAGPRLVYRLTWWISPLALIAAGVLRATTAELPPASVVSALGAACAAAAALRYPLRRIPEDSDEVSRRSVSRDPHRRRRLLALGGAGTAVVASLLLNP
jgi:hypothetical protein